MRVNTSGVQPGSRTDPKGQEKAGIKAVPIIPVEIRQNPIVDVSLHNRQLPVTEKRSTYIQAMDADIITDDDL